MYCLDRNIEILLLVEVRILDGLNITFTAKSQSGLRI